MTQADKDAVIDFIYRYGTLEPDDANNNLELDDVIAKEDMADALKMNDEDWELASRAIEYLNPIAKFYEDI